jgi:hypothetical protein
MLGGYNVKPLIDLLGCATCGTVAAEGLKKTLLVFDFFHDVAELAKAMPPPPPTPRRHADPGPTPSGSPRVRKSRLRRS